MAAGMECKEEPTITVTIKRGITPLVQVEIEPAGSWYHQYEECRLRGGDYEDKSETNSDDSSKERSNQEIIVEDDICFLRSLNPADWKDQDHYKVLGLEKYRYKATDEDIKKAHRQMVLRHHPDKRRGAGEEVRDGDDYFTNITKAHEILGDPSKRRSYDSVDPDFDDKVPGGQLANREKFYEVFAPMFELNTRWSQRKHVPQLGDADASQQKVELFYDFWYNFDSWREFSYLDEEDKEKGEDRDERRWIEKQNKAERAVRKKEENARIRKLVDNAYKLDPRIARFREEERDKRMALKRAKQEAIRQKQEIVQNKQLRLEEEENKRKEKEEAELKIKQAKDKKEREVLKRELKHERKQMRTLCKDADYFITDERDRVQAMMDVETLCDGLLLLQLRDISGRVSQSKQDKEATRKMIKKEVNDLRSGKLENINITMGNMCVASSSSSGNNKNNKGKSNVAAVVVDPEWRNEELQTLIKAVNLFPAGTAKRWDVVAQYLCQHGGETRPAKAVLAKAKSLQQQQNTGDQQLKDAANKSSLAALANQTSTVVTAPATQRFDTPQEFLGVNLSQWTPDEQKLLEQALKTFPGTVADRWDRISECIPNRNKKACMRRYKELAEMVKAKKAAVTAAAASK